MPLPMITLIRKPGCRIQVTNRQNRECQRPNQAEGDAETEREQGSHAKEKQINDQQHQDPAGDAHLREVTGDVSVLFGAGDQVPGKPVFELRVRVAIMAGLDQALDVGFQLERALIHGT